MLNGLQVHDFSVINPAAKLWMETIANVRIHGETQQRPVDLLVKEKPALQAMAISQPYDIGTVLPVRATSRFRVSFDSNRYSVPAEYASTALILKVYPDRLCIYHQNRLIARHSCCYDRHRDI